MSRSLCASPTAGLTPGHNRTGGDVSLGHNPIDGRERKVSGYGGSDITRRAGVEIATAWLWIPLDAVTRRAIALELIHVRILLDAEANASFVTIDVLTIGWIASSTLAVPLRC